MIGVSAIAVCMMAFLPSAVKNTNIAFEEFKKDCGYADCILQTELAPRRYAEKLSIVDGVEEVNQRIGLAAYMKNPNGNISTAMVCSYLDEDFYDRHVLKETDKSPDMINVSVEKRYAENNSIDVGQTIELYLYGTKIDAYVSSIVYTPETIYVTANPYLMADNSGFGYIFIEDQDLAEAVKKSESGNFEVFWADFFGGLIKNGNLQYSNQVLIKCEEGADKKAVLEACEKELSKHVAVKSTSTQDQTSSAGYMQRFDRAFGMIAKAFPIFFYLIMLFIVVMFLNQMVMYLTRDIGVLRALGASRKDITKLLSAFAFIMSLGAVLVGYVISIFLCDFCTKVLLDVYQLPKVSTKLDITMVILSLVITVLVGQISAIISGLKANKISPKEAMSNNESKKKNLSPKIEKFLDRFSSEKKLSICIGIQNPRRVIVSVFSIAAAFMLIFVSFSYKESKDSIITQVMGERYNFDICYFSSDSNNSKVFKKLSELDGVDDIEIIQNAKVTATGTKGQMEINICGVDPDGQMLLFPDENGKVGNVKIEEEGIWLNIDQARKIGAKVGDVISIEGVPVEVKGLTHEYMNFVSPMSTSQMEKINTKKTTSFLMQVSDRTALDKFLIEQSEASVISSYERMYEDIKLRIQPLDILVVIMVVFAILMAVIILVMMSQASLLEQKRLVCTMKVLGFSSKDISKMWLRQEILYSIVGIVIGIPMSIACYNIIVNAVNNEVWSFPILIKPLIMILTVGIIAATVAVTHFLAMRITKKWNLAESTKDRE